MSQLSRKIVKYYTKNKKNCIIFFIVQILYIYIYIIHNMLLYKSIKICTNNWHQFGVIFICNAFFSLLSKNHLSSWSTNGQTRLAGLSKGGVGLCWLTGFGERSHVKALADRGDRFLMRTRHPLPAIYPIMSASLDWILNIFSYEIFQI